MKYIFKMKNKIQPYAWGSTDFIPNLLGSVQTDQPQAEMWMGAHPKASSTIIDRENEITLLNFIEANKRELLGEKMGVQYGGRLPFLLKILSAAKPLSIQVHPNKKQAEMGFAKDNENKINLLAFNRRYKDDNHKPELICALTEFDAMCGFQPVEAIKERFENLNVLADISQEFCHQPNSETFKKMFIKLMNLSTLEKSALVNDVLSKINNPRSENEQLIFDWIYKLNEEYPGDIGVLSPLYLNVIRLQPGEALYLDAGVMHAYLKGTGIEIMANSDNVLRGGLTPKFIDLPELQKIIVFENKVIKKVEIRANAQEDIYRTIASEFELSRINLKSSFSVNSIDSPEIILCTKGSAKLIAEQEIELKAGESVFIGFGCKEYNLLGTGEFFRAKVPGKDIMK